MSEGCVFLKLVFLSGSFSSPASGVIVFPVLRFWDDTMPPLIDYLLFVWDRSYVGQVGLELMALTPECWNFKLILANDWPLLASFFFFFLFTCTLCPACSFSSLYSSRPLPIPSFSSRSTSTLKKKVSFPGISTEHGPTSYNKTSIDQLINKTDKRWSSHLPFICSWAT